jgi:hypothetical protein
MSEYESATEESIALAWERERFDRLWQIEMECKCEEAMSHLKIRMERSQNGIDYDLEFGEK